MSVSKEQLALMGYKPDGSKLPDKEQAKHDREQKESVLQESCEAILKAHGHWFFHLRDYKGVRGNRPGIPDLICGINGVFVAFELKVNNRQLDPDQIIEWRKIRGSNCEYHVIRSRKQFLAIVKTVENFSIRRPEF